MPDRSEDRLTREREFHDQLATALEPERMPPEPLGELDRAMIALADDVTGKRVLDLGCGAGNITLALLERGVRVTAVDLSPGMVDVARRRAQAFAAGKPAEFVVAAAEQLPLPDASVELVVGRFILHHLELPEAIHEIARVLAPGGVVVFAENSGRNPLLMFARRHLAGKYGIPRFGTEDEQPLSAEDFAGIRSVLPEARLAYPVFDFFKIFDRQVLRYRWKPVSSLLSGLDRTIWRLLPFARPWSFRVVVYARKQA